VIDSLSRVGVTGWAVISFRAIAKFPGPVNVLSAEPLEGATRGARFESFSLLDPDTLLVRYVLDSPCREEERVETGGFQIESLFPGDVADPFFPLTLSKRPQLPDADHFFEAVVITSSKVPPPGRPDYAADFFFELKRAIPV
jgi:hypothetical protein